MAWSVLNHRSMHADAVATPMFAAEPHPVVDSSGEVLLSLRERIRRATTEEVQLRWKLLLRQLERLARLTALELARKGEPDPSTLRTVVATIEERCSEAPDSRVGLLACHIACAALSRRGRARGGSRVGRSTVLASFEGLRLDARTLFEWAKADLWTAIARMAVIQANQTADALDGSAVLPDPGRSVVRPGGIRGEGDELAQVAEDLAIRELSRLLALPTVTPVRTPRGPTEAPLRRRVVRSAGRPDLREVPRPA